MLSWSVRGNHEPFFGQGFMASRETKELGVSVLSRDGFRCVDCGFNTRPSSQVPSGFFQIRAMSGNYNSRSSADFESVCPCCHSASNALEAVVSGSYRLIVAPWLSQQEASLLSMTALSIISDESHLYFPDALAAYNQLLAGEARLSSYLEKMPQKKESAAENVAFFCQALADVDDKYYAKNDRWVKPLRIIPYRKTFKVEVDYFRQAVFDTVPLKHWERLTEWKTSS